jgi:uncharacterized damage-inducible protein DinB
VADLNTPELETLGRYLDANRAVIGWKLEGVPEVDARRQMVPSGTSLLGVVKHLAYVERWWFQVVLAGVEAEFPWTAEDPDADLRPEEGDTVESITALYRDECARSREVLAGIDDPAALRPLGDGEVSVRRVLIHMVEETARHAGHLDILREQIDGATGLAPGD